jgi:hypothetical protein
MSFSRPIQWYHHHANLLWPDNTVRTFKVLLSVGKENIHVFVING